MKHSGFGFYIVGFGVLHTTLGFIFDGDMFGGGSMAAMVGISAMGGMEGLMGGGMDGTGTGIAMGGMDGVFGGGMGTTGGAMGGTESFYGVATGGAAGTTGGMAGLMGGGVGGTGNGIGAMESLFGGIMGTEMGAATGVHGLLGGEMATAMGGGGMNNMFGQFGQGQRAPVTKKCMSPFWLKYCKCNFLCPQGHVSYGNCEDFKENSFLPTMCCPETVHYACVGFEF
ncbi:acanthoscurrin-2-like [Pecten maximus]|uniref:acanthoscurrin-2-like n=1 Tax=Pecten maximus TaxID=6579 RepID=UPI00145832D1|nr:acanthoscurrin-2-like [Pecten maximus]